MKKSDAQNVTNSLYLMRDVTKTSETVVLNVNIVDMFSKSGLN